MTAKSKQQMLTEHITIQSTLEARSAKKPRTARTIRNTTCSLNILLWITFFFFEAAELDAVALLADTWDNDLDPEGCAQLVHTSVRKVRVEVKASFLFAHHVFH